MACCGGSSSVVITGGANTIVTGSGTIADPYVISGNLEVILQTEDTTTIEFDLTGAGTEGDPFVLSAVATVSVNDLVDVIDPTPPVTGDVLVFDGTKWTYGAVSVAAGAIYTDDGLDGDGTVGDPLVVKVSNTTETSTSGLYTYIDSLGELRAERPSTATVAWGDITGKPSTFAPTRPLAADTIANAFNPGVYPGIKIWVGPTAPVGATDNDIWFNTA